MLLQFEDLHISPVEMFSAFGAFPFVSNIYLYVRATAH